MSATKTGTVDSVNSTGQEGLYTDENGNQFEFMIPKPNVSINPGESVKVVAETPSGRPLSVHVVIEKGGVEI